jgi:hypothetical protein
MTVFDPNLTEWRIMLCNRMGVAISLLDNVAINRQFKFGLNQPGSLTFDVPSDEPSVNILHTDGYPYLSCGDRTVRAWRKESGVWTLRYTGIVWQLADASDEDVCHTTVTCFDALKFLKKRLICTADGRIKGTIRLPKADLGTTVYTMISNSFDNFGPLYLDYSSGPWVTGTSITPPDYELAYIDASIKELCDTGAMDIEMTPVYSTGGVLSTFAVTARLGQDQPHVLFGYDTGNYGAQTWGRQMNAEDTANDIYNFATSASGPMSNATDAASKTRFGTMQSAEVLSDIHSKDTLDELTTWELRFRKEPQDLVSFTPRPELQPVLWNDYWIGDTVRVASSANVREAISGVQRVYGVTLDVNDDGYEVVSELVVSAGQE